MITFRPKIIVISIFIFTLLLTSNIQGARPQWYQDYEKGIKAMVNQSWQTAIQHFDRAIKIKNEDKGKLRAFGTIFIEYYPHREMGICNYHLGNIDEARKELHISLQQSSSKRAKLFLERIQKGNYPKSITVTPPPIETTREQSFQEQPAVSEKDAEPFGSEIVGDRMSIAVLPFDSKGLGNELGSIDLLDKLVTGFVNINRFKVIERALLEKILEEQQLGMSGVLDASTAAQIGKGIGVDAVVVGSVTRAHNALSIDARFIDTETATILTAKDAYSARISLQDVSQMINNLALKFKEEIPLLNGYVINVVGNEITLDLGRSNGIKKGMKCHVYREGAPIIHPVTGKVIAREIDELCEVQINEVFDAYSNALVIQNKSGLPKIRDKCVTK